MAGFATYDDVINALTIGGRAQTLLYQKVTFTTVAGQLHSYWTAGGTPAAGTFGTALTGRIMTDADLGAVTYTNSAGGRTMHLLSLMGISAVAVGTMILYDRLAEYPFNGTVTSGTFASGGVLAHGRDAGGLSDGIGVTWFLENISAAATAAVTFTPTYTNEAGTGSRTAAGTTLATTANTWRLANPANFPWWTMAAGDRGIRSVQSYTSSATMTSTAMNLVLARPLIWLPVVAASSAIERDCVMQIPAMPRLYDNSCLAWLLWANTTSAAMNASVTIAEN
jgi:hypothetical protein